MISLNLSPVTADYILTPGETYTGRVTVTNPYTSTTDITVTAHSMPFSVIPGSRDYEIDFSSRTTATMIADWITIPEPTRVISPGTHADIDYTITVPQDAPGGGQYAAISVSLAPDAFSQSGTSVSESVGVSQLIYATVQGDVWEEGRVESSSIGLISFDQQVHVDTVIENTGNAHTTAFSTLEIYPLFSEHDVFIDETESSTRAVTILPGQVFAISRSWEGDMFGIYHVVHTIQMGDELSTSSRYVLLCPIWAFLGTAALILLFILRLIFHPHRRYKY